MDSLAARGTRFTRAYAANPICVPSRFSMITGRMPSVIGLRSNRPYFHHQEPLGAITPEIKQTAIGHRLRAAGYETAYAGKQHLVRSHAEEYGFTVLTEDWRDICVSAAVDFLLAPHDAPIALQVHLMNPHDISLMAPRDAQETEEERRWVASELDAIENLDLALEWPAGISEEAFYARFLSAFTRQLCSTARGAGDTPAVVRTSGIAALRPRTLGRMPVASASLGVRSIDRIC